MNSTIERVICHRDPIRPAALGAVAGLILLVFALQVPAALDTRYVLGSGVQLNCAQPTMTLLEFDYRLVTPSSVVEQVSASARSVTLPAPEFEAYIEPPSSSAVLFLVDTSDPARQQVIETNIKHISALLDAGEPHHQFGLSSFDRDIRVLAPIGASPEEINAAAGEMRAVGKTTELYRNTLQAVRMLANHSAERRALLLMSDGLAEDRAYFHDDVVRAARASGVVIYGIGYPRSVSLSVGLQTLRRIAEETGGPFVAVENGSDLPAAFLDAPFAALDNGGRVSFDLEAATEAGVGGAFEVRAEFRLADGRASAAIPASLPALSTGEQVVKVIEVEVPKVVEVPKFIEVPAPSAAAPQGATGAAQGEAPGSAVSAPPAMLPDKLNVWLWYILIPAALLISLLLVLLLTLRSRRGEPAAAPAGEPPISLRTLAFLEPHDGSGERYAVTSAAYRIGRHSDNDLTIQDPSVSRQHAEIHRKRDGSFTITDLGSVNGVFVNQKKIESATLADGDIVEIGDRAYRFNVQVNEDLGGEDTVVLKTMNPVSPLPEVRAGGS
jgi:hypothetical protein